MYCIWRLLWWLASRGHSVGRGGVLAGLLIGRRLRLVGTLPRTVLLLRLGEGPGAVRAELTLTFLHVQLLDTLEELGFDVLNHEIVKAG